MRKHPVLPIILAANLAACAADRSPTAPQADANAALAASLVSGPGCTSVSGTLYGHHETNPPAWVGKFLVSLGGADPLGGTFVDRPLGVDLEKLLAGKPFRGREVLTLKFDKGGSFDVIAEFIGVPASTPGLYDLNETGDITNGTGEFAGASGNVTAHGPFVSPFVDPLPPWIAQMRGTVCGIE